MGLLYKEDWEETQARFRAWWNHEDIGRCAIAVTAPRRDPPPSPPPPEPESVEQKWYDLDWISRSMEYHLSRAWYGGEAFPIWNGGYPGHTAIPSFLGCPTTLDMNTGWWEPILTEPERLDVSALRLDEKDRNYLFSMALLRRGAGECAGKAMLTTGAFGGSGDTLAALRGTEQLLIDCVERPDQVRAADELMMDMWFDVFDRYYAIVKDVNQGSTGWFPLWAPGKFYAAQNDFSYNIGPAMFRDLFLPVIKRQTEFLDFCVYHVDGVEAFRHVDALCELPRLQCLQIAPGAGKPSPLHYMDVLKKVQKAGKNIHISLSANEVEMALSSLSSRGLFIATWAATEAEGRALLQNAERWSRP